MPIYFTIKQTKHKNTQRPVFSYDMKMGWWLQGVQSINTERASYSSPPPSLKKRTHTNTFTSTPLPSLLCIHESMPSWALSIIETARGNDWNCVQFHIIEKLVCVMCSSTAILWFYQIVQLPILMHTSLCVCSSHVMSASFLLLSALHPPQNKQTNKQPQQNWPTEVNKSCFVFAMVQYRIL